MVAKKSSRGPVSNISAAASTKISAAAAKKSSILRSSFAPSEFQLSLFASVIQGFDSQQLRIHDILTGRLRCEHAIGAGAQINSLDWGYFGSSQQSPKQNKKRKRQSNGAADQYLPEQAVIAFGTSESDIRFFSPAEDKIVAILKGGHERDVKQFKFTEGSFSEGWSIGGDGKLIHWDLTTQKPLRTISLPNNSVSVLARPTLRTPQILCASSIPYAIDLTTGSSQEITSFDAFRNPIHTLVRSGVQTDQDNEFFVAADSDRYMNVYDIQQQRLAKTLVAEFEVEGFTTSRDSEILAAVTKNGVVQLFKTPFSTAGSESSTISKRSKRNTPSRPDATVRLVRPDTSKTVVPLLAASVENTDLVFAWVESGVNLLFDRITWQAEGSSTLAFEGVKDIVRGKSSSLLNSTTMNGAHDVGKTFVDESQAIVTTGGPVTGKSSAVDEVEHEDEAASDEESDEDAATNHVDGNEAESSDEDVEDAEMADADDVASEAGDEEKDAEDAEPSFGEMLADKHPDPIAIAGALIPTDTDAVSTLNKDLTIPSGLSLATVLTQSLRTNDQNLLESCFHTTDTTTVRLTIQRLDSSLAATLLQKLADRLARRPGRYGHLLVWVQWVCVAHGGAIAGRRDVLEKIQSLFRVLNQRARSLDNLLLLKGKLDMLDAQISLRKQMQAERQSKSSIPDQNEEDVIYIEGDDESSSDEDEAAPTKSFASIKASKSKGPRKTLQELADEDAESEDDEDMPMTNGIMSEGESDDESEGSYAQKEGGLVDDEAEDSHPSDNEIDQSEEENSDDEEDSEMDDFINDDSLSEVEVDEDDLEMDEMPEKPPSKKSKRK